MERKTKHIKILYYFSLASWILNICFVIISFSLDIQAAWIIVFFISVLIQGFVSGAFGDETAIPSVKTKRKFLDYCLNISGILSVIFTVIGGISLLIAGGGPEIIDNAYCIVNHGETVRVISSPTLFLFLCICDFMIFNCGMLVLSSLMALRIRKLYLSHMLQFSNKYSES